jgi:hypothetical protein
MGLLSLAQLATALHNFYETGRNIPEDQRVVILTGLVVTMPRAYGSRENFVTFRMAILVRPRRTAE